MWKEYGILRVGGIVPSIKVADVSYNTLEIISRFREANDKGISIVSTPELSLTGYTCGDLFYQNTLFDEVIKNLSWLLEETKDLDVIGTVGMPYRYKNKLYDVVVVINRGNILGMVPKSNISRYESRWFSSGKGIRCEKVRLCDQEVLFGSNILFRDRDNKDICFGIEIGDEFRGLQQPSVGYVLNGASIIVNPSAGGEVVLDYDRRVDLVKGQSSRCKSVYCYVASGVNESTSDNVFSGHAMIAENGSVLVENERFKIDGSYIYADVDVENLIGERIRENGFDILFGDEYQYVDMDVVVNIELLEREYLEYPFVPKNVNKDKFFGEIFEMQACGLAKRMLHIGTKKTVIGMSGGMDSTLAYLVILEAYKKLGIDFKNIIGVTMPGFGTTGRTYKNACDLVKNTGATLMEVPIRDACIGHFKDIGLPRDDRSITYENSQARERTQILMDIANMCGGLVVGTGDLSELALGWCTYNGDHMSMYSVNAGIPKTLVRELIKWKVDSSDKVIEVLKDIVDTPISPELLPPDEFGKIKQITEDSVGPYVLHDFFLYHFFKYGNDPVKIYLLAKHTFYGKFSDDEIKKWLYEFFRRFFNQQFKRNCVPDGVAVFDVGFSPRGSLMMPSDASSNVWLAKIKKL